MISVSQPAPKSDGSTVYALRGEGLGMDFNGFVAVRNVSLNVRSGSVHGLIGPNGAGKTTVFNLLTRFLTPTSGRIFYGDQDITRVSAGAVARMGIARSFQISAVFRPFTALENVRFALQRKSGLSWRFWNSRDVLRRMDDEAAGYLAQVGLADYRNIKAQQLSYGRKRALEIATTLATEPRVMLLDEPMAGMAHEDIGAITDLLRRVASGRTVIMVEHNLRVVADICDVVTVLQRGEVLAEGTYDEVSRNPDVRRAYVGDHDA